MKLDFFSLLVLLGALQALFFGIFLLFSPTNNRFQNRMLAFFILILSYNGFETLNWSASLYGVSYIFDLFPFVLILGAGPCIYLYVRSFRAASVIRRPWRHFLPVFFSAGFRVTEIILWFLYRNERATLMKIARVDGWYGAIIEPVTVLLFMIYLALAFREYQQLLPANVEAGAWVDEEARFVMRWLKTLLIAMGVMALAWAGTLVYAALFHVGGGPQYYVIEVLAVALIYWTAFAGYHRTRVIYMTQVRKQDSFFSQLPVTAVDDCVDALNRAMEEHVLFLDPDLTLNVLAEKTGIAPKVISSVLNQRLQKGFNEYVNGWRVEAVKKMILDPSNSHLTIMGMAFECGFNSQPTFQRAFKAATGKTPGQFQAANRQNQP